MAKRPTSARGAETSGSSRCVRLLFALVVLALAGCASDPAPIVDMSGAGAEARPRPAPVPAASAAGTYRVVRGDTLYAIAFRHGLDYRDVAAWNRIEAPYRIFVGQDLRLSAPGGSASSHVATAAPVASVAAKAPPAAGASVATPRPEAPAAGTAATAPVRPGGTSTGKPGMFEDVTANGPAPEAAPASNGSVEPARPTAPTAPVPIGTTKVPAEEPATRPASDAAKPAIPEPPPRIIDDSVAVSTGGVTWRWPGRGTLVATFVAGDQTRQGIDVAGKAGDPVLAAADGEVVYSGNGLLGYGELIIVKHNANFLSAYGHNRKRLVQEGDRVRSGQQIAEMGSTASSRDELHFEIRKNGKPVNPLEYLPAR